MRIPAVLLLGLMIAMNPLTARSAAAQKVDAARDLYISGRDSMDERRFSEAEKIFRSVLQKYPKSDVADRSSYYLIVTLERLGRAKDALAEITNFKKNYPKSTWANDVEEERISLTNQIPANWNLLITPPSPPSPPQATATPFSAPRPAPNATPFGKGPAAPSSEDDRLNQEILRVIIQKEPDRGVEVAAERLKADPGDTVVLANLSAIANSSSNKALPLLISIAKTSSNNKARRDATFFIASSRADKDSLVTTLLEIGANAKDAETENAVVNALGQINNPRAISALADFIRDRNRGTNARKSAISLFARNNGPNALPMLEEFYRNASDSADLRRSIVSAIGRISDPKTISVLSSIVKNDPDMNTRWTALQAIGSRKEPEAQKALEDLLKDAPAPKPGVSLDDAQNDTLFAFASPDGAPNHYDDNFDFDYNFDFDFDYDFDNLDHIVTNVDIQLENTDRELDEINRQIDAENRRIDEENRRQPEKF